MYYHILDENKRVVPVDVADWLQWIVTADRRVGWDEILPGVVVSTVFLQGGHYENDFGVRCFFETMLFINRAPTSYEVIDRSPTWETAVAGHRRAVRRFRKVCPACWRRRKGKLVCAGCGFQFKPLDRWRFVVTPHGVRITVGP